MRLAIPVYLRQPEPGGPFVVSALTLPGASSTNHDVERALTVVRDDLRRRAANLIAAGDHVGLAAMAGDAEVEDLRISVDIDLRSRHLSAEVLLAVLPGPAGIRARLLDLPGPWFHAPGRPELAARTAEILRHRLKALLDRGADLPAIAAAKRAWIQVETIVCDLSDRRKKTVDDRPRAGVASNDLPDGWEELERCGLRQKGTVDEANGRAELADQLEAVLNHRQRRPVLMVGPPGAGKSALIRTVAARRVSIGSIWHLSPGRLISGMSFVGQWEARLEAILGHAERLDLVLWFDDLVGLFRAGQSSASTFNAGALLKRWLGRVRIVAEATWEAAHAAAELDRGFTDALQVLPVPPLGETAARAAVIRLAAGLETDPAVRFGPGTLDTCLALARRLRPDRVLPGSAAALVRALAAQGGAADPGAVITHAAATTGLARELIDPDLRCDREQLATKLSHRLSGQPAAVAAMADALVLAKAGLNDPSRPLASFLFTGPTGSGKTRAAVALAEVLFGGGGGSRLIRIDLNEYAGSDAVERLVGSTHRPEGVLTAAIRRQPFSVILLDEIEKADSGVADLLLQVLGEGRLTDAVGRTASFANAVVVMTSNLGAKPADAGLLGFTASDDGSAWRQAVAEFFRPEFCARIDRLVPFATLPHETMQRIAGEVLADLARRDGLRQRRWQLDVRPEALAVLADQAAASGTLGRGVRGAIQQLVVAPLAEALAVASNRFPARVVVAGSPAPHRDHPLTVSVHPYQPVAPRPVRDFPQASEARVEALLGTLAQRRGSGPIALDAADPGLADHFTLKESLERLRRRFRRSSPDLGPAIDLGERLCDDAYAAWASGQLMVRTDANSRSSSTTVEVTAIDLALAEFRCTHRFSEATVIATADGAAEDRAVKAMLFALYTTLDGTGIGPVRSRTEDIQASAAAAWTVAGHGAAELLAPLAGRHLAIAADGSVVALQVTVAVNGAATISRDAVVRVSDTKGGLADLSAGRYLDPPSRLALAAWLLP
ncbi:hypothetical protein LBMAG53_31670 [Planctomycetota bacterium]|nr:hypothetical protein LBMAG53_31670 [Planctomycetota bacterium]